MPTFVKMISIIKTKDKVLSNFSHNDLLDLNCMIEYFDEETKEEWYKSIDMLMNGEKMKIKIKYFDKELPRIEKIKQGDWLDLRAAETIHLKQGQFKGIPLGVAMQLPDGYEAHVVPRSSTFKNFGIIQTNSFGVIDNSYCGDDDEWFFPAYATRDTIVNKGDRICQFRIQEKMPNLDIEIVNVLGNENRGGHGSTGVN